MKIRNKKGKHVLTVEDNGRIWKLTDSKTATDIGHVVNRVCNVYTIYGLQDYNTEKYVPVVEDILKYRRKLRIKRLRRIFQTNSTNGNGPVISVKYGYIDRENLGKLLRKRKSLRERPQGVPVVLTKLSDWEMHSK